MSFDLSNFIVMEESSNDLKISEEQSTACMGGLDDREWACL